jgi:hypothetical protein
MGGSWEGRGSSEWAPDGDGLGRLKTTNDGKGGWSLAVEIELRRFTGPGWNLTAWW